MKVIKPLSTSTSGRILSLQPTPELHPIQSWNCGWVVLARVILGWLVWVTLEFIIKFELPIKLSNQPYPSPWLLAVHIRRRFLIQLSYSSCNADSCAVIARRLVTEQWCWCANYILQSLHFTWQFADNTFSCWRVLSVAVRAHLSGKQTFKP